MLRSVNAIAVRGLRSGMTLGRSASFRSFRTIAPQRLDFNALSEKITTVDARAELDAFRRTHNEVLQQAASIGEIKTIDWAYYAQNIKSVGLVDSFKKATESLTPQTMNNPFEAELEENFAALMKEAEEAKTFSEGQILELEAKLNEMNTVGDIKSVTMAEEAAKYPEIVAEIEEEINNHEWFK